MRARIPALLRGFHRSFCLWSHRYRGHAGGAGPGARPRSRRRLPRRGLPRPGAAAAEVLRYLDDRELPDGAEQVYHRRVLPVRLLDRPGRPAVPAIAYVANRACRLYAPSLAPEQAAAAIARGVGQMGANRDYLLNTVAHLREMGVRDAGLDRIAALLALGSEAA
jgi:cation transport protein ChaC